MLVTQSIVKNVIDIIKFRKSFSEFYNIGLKTLMQQGISELEFYGDLV